MFRSVRAGLGRWACGAPASSPAASCRPSIITSRSHVAMAASSGTPHSLFLARHQHLSQQVQNQRQVPLPPSRGLSTSRDSTAAQHEAEAEAAAAEGGEDGVLEAPKPPRNSLVGVVVSDKMDKSIVVKVRCGLGAGWVWLGWR